VRRRGSLDGRPRYRTRWAVKVQIDPAITTQVGRPPAASMTGVDALSSAKAFLCAGISGDASPDFTRHAGGAPCALDDQSAGPRTSPHRLTPARGPCDQGHGDRARVPARPDRHARRPCAAARRGLGLPVGSVTVFTLLPIVRQRRAKTIPNRLERARRAPSNSVASVPRPTVVFAEAVSRG
jgi:hypothetical protein